jgi:hypothetical protein
LSWNPNCGFVTAIKGREKVFKRRRRRRRRESGLVTVRAFPGFCSSIDKSYLLPRVFSNKNKLRFVKTRREVATALLDEEDLKKKYGRR